MRRALVALVAAPFLLAACGGSGSSSSTVTLTPAAYVMQAAAKSAQATSEHVDLKAATAVQGEAVTITGAGDFDNAKHEGQMTVHANLQGIDVQIEEVISDTALYMKSPLLQAAVPKGKTWLKIDLQKIAKSQGIDFSSLFGQDPAQSFSQLQASGQVTKVGDETIGGVDTAHYRGHIDASKLPPALAKLKATYGPYDVWIDQDGYVRRMRMSYGVQKQTVAMTMNFSDFGKDVTVTIPAASETSDATDQSIQGLGG
jgi:hypothetical protein